MALHEDVDPLPVGLALGLFGVGALAMTMVTLGADNVTYARAEWTARLSLVLAAPAIVLYALPGRLGQWWRAFWTAGMLAYLLHFWWAVFGVYRGDVGAIHDRQGFVALSNALVTLLWVADVTVAWALPWQAAYWMVMLRAANWTLVTVSFVVASAVFRDEMLPKALGILLAVAVVSALLSRKMARGPSGVVRAE